MATGFLQFDPNYLRYLGLFLFMTLSLVASPCLSSSVQELPSLGDQASGVVSQDKEFITGRAWLRMLRGRAPIIHDPLLNDYINHLTYHLASYSDLKKPNLEIVIIKDSGINAFAVPGGVLGMNAGLLLHAESEDELSAVLAHELAHLSQRHFARNVEKAKRNQWTTIAALIASVALMASSDSPDAGMAALLTTQAASLQSQLAFSRQNEHEADRLGMITLANAGKDPTAMPRFFERMHKATRTYSQLPPEFLLTHPVTENRISDSYNRAQHLPKIPRQPSLDFALMKARVEASYGKDKMKNLDIFKLRLLEANTPTEKAAARYGLTRSLLKVNRYDAALEALAPLRKAEPHRITYLVTEVEIYMAQDKYLEARKLLEQGLSLAPDSHTLGIYHAQVLLRTKAPDLATDILKELILKKPTDPQLWRLLSEAHGADGNIIGVHEARAEVFFLHNRTEQALQQLNYALKLTKEDFPRTTRIRRRIEEIRSHQHDLRI